ncbi:MAG: hypothetical protein KDA88_03215 [Planctomycetaceae bacterium]|nr:hypothetical protein [Planctomycetaceae bacterium]
MPCRSQFAGPFGKAVLCPPQFDHFYCRYIDDFRSKSAARRTARESLRCLRREGITCDFREGFENAFEDVSTGSRGQIPSQPPPPYWNMCARSPDGHARVEQWYAGYRVGIDLALAHYGDHNRVHPAGMECPAANYPQILPTQIGEPMMPAEPTPVAQDFVVPQLMEQEPKGVASLERSRPIR